MSPVYVGIKSSIVQLKKMHQTLNMNIFVEITPQDFFLGVCKHLDNQIVLLNSLPLS